MDLFGSNYEHLRQNSLQLAVNSSVTVFLFFFVKSCESLTISEEKIARIFQLDFDIFLVSF